MDIIGSLRPTSSSLTASRINNRICNGQRKYDILLKRLSQSIFSNPGVFVYTEKQIYAHY